MPEQGNDFTLIARMLSDGFNRLDHRLDELNRRLDQKADIASVASLEANLAAFKVDVDKRFRPLEEEAIGDAAVSKARRRVTNALVAIAASSVGALLYLIVSGGVH